MDGVGSVSMVPAPLHGRAPHRSGGGRPGQGHTLEEALALRRKDPSRKCKNGKSHKWKTFLGVILSFPLNGDDLKLFCMFGFRLEPLLLSRIPAQADTNILVSLPLDKGQKHLGAFVVFNSLVV